MRNFAGLRTTASGVPLRIAPSFAFLVVGLLGLFGLRLWSTTPLGITVIVAIVGASGVLASTLLHELAHARSALRRGVGVTDITLLAVGGVTQLAAAPANAKDDAAIAASGPWLSLILGCSAGLVATALGFQTSHPFTVALADAAGVLAWWNLALSGFNALPGAPLDGGRLVRAAVWAKTGNRTTGARAAARAGQALGVILAASGAAFSVFAPLPPWIRSAIAVALVITAAGIARGATRELASLDGSDEPVRAAPAPYVVDLADRLRAAFGVAVVTAASLLVPLPLIEVAPAPVRPVVPLITFEDVTTYPTDGEVLMLIVTRGQRAALPALIAAIDPNRDLVPLEQVYPPGTDRLLLRNVNLARFARQFDIAVAVGARTVGVDTAIVSEVVVIHVQPGSAADRLLAPGDTILAINGRDTTDATQVQDAIRNHPTDTALTVTFRRGGTVRDVTLTARMNPERGVPELGIAVDTAVDGLRLPFRIALAEQLRIGGPSAGVAVGLTVVERLTEESLFQGRRVAATGTLDVNGVVGPVGDIPEKMRAAGAGDADVVFVPKAQLADAQANAPAGLTIVGIDTLDEAISYLGGVAAS